MYGYMYMCICTPHVHVHYYDVLQSTAVPFESVYKSYLPTEDDTISSDTVMFLKPPPSLSPSARTRQHSKEKEARGISQAEGGVAFEEVTSHSLPIESLQNIVHDSYVESNHDISGTEAFNVSTPNINIHGDFTALSSQGMPSSADPEINLDSVPVMQQTNGGQNSNGVSSSSTVGETGMTTTNMSLFQDPLMYYVSNSNAPAVQGPGHFQNDISSATLEYFPALKETVSGIVSNDSIATVEGAHSQNGHNVNSQGPDFGGSSGGSSKPKRQGSAPITPLLNEQFDNAEHYKYRSSTSSALPENWPDVPSEVSTARDNINQPSNDQGQDPSTPHNSQGSAGFDIEHGALVREDLNVSSPNGNELEEATNTAGNGHSVDIVSKSVTRQDSLLDVNAKEFTPKVDSPGLPPASTPVPFPSGLNPNAASYAYPTNGAQSLTGTVLEHVGSSDDDGVVDSASITCDSSLCVSCCVIESCILHHALVMYI